MLFLLILINLIYLLNGQSLVEQNLKESLFNSNYDKTTRPNNTVIIQFMLEFRQIVNLDEKNQIITTSVYITLTWYDPRLIWSDYQYPIDYMTVKANKLWLPDLYVLNAADSNGFLTVTDSNLALLSKEGKIILNYDLNGVKTRCTINVFKFPFDQQICNLTIGSWFQRNQEIHIVVDKITNKWKGMEKYIKNPVWEFVTGNVEVINTTRLGETYTTDDVYCTAVIKRSPLYYLINNVYPSLILNLITLLTFFLPFALQTSLTLTIFLNMAIISVRVSSDIPVQSEYLPLISLFFVLSLFYTFASLFWFILVNHFRTKNKIPSFLETLANFSFKNYIKYVKKNKIEPINNEITTKFEDKSKYVDDLITKINILAFSILLIFMFSSYLAIWIKIAN